MTLMTFHLLQDVAVVVMILTCTVEGGGDWFEPKNYVAFLIFFRLMVEQYGCLPLKADRLLPNPYRIAVLVQFLFLLQATYPPQLKYRRYVTQESVTRCHIQRANKFTFYALSLLFALGTTQCFLFFLLDR
jgi:hypothetical protein